MPNANRGLPRIRSQHSVPLARMAGAGVLVAWLATGACSSATLQTAEGFRAMNRENMSRLGIGMPREEVISIMGTHSMRPLGTESSGAVRTAEDTLGVTQVQIPIGAQGPSLFNPMRTGMYGQAEQTWEVLFYYTRLADDDGVVTDDELTPVVLRDGYLAGIGWPYWIETARTAGIYLESGNDIR